MDAAIWATGSGEWIRALGAYGTRRPVGQSSVFAIELLRRVRGEDKVHETLEFAQSVKACAGDAGRYLGVMESHGRMLRRRTETAAGGRT